ncbi:MAG: Hsp70 family protein [Pirellulaceae bacterium]
MSARYVVGIDLGTTNSVVAYAPLEAERPAIELLPIPQLVSPGTIESLNGLPSFLYLAPDHESSQGGLDLPWSKGNRYATGEIARRMSAEHPERTVAAAKSWLCHSRADRHQPILPWNAPAEVAKISPVQATQRLLEHLIHAWNAAFPDARLGDQYVVLTVPASFDAVARELTREAAVSAGLPDDLLLFEEPQAAVYAWLAASGDRWRKRLNVGDKLLVCDVGGGTTDLTLISVHQEQGELALQRTAVGKHLLVGGDNMDLALAHFAASRFGEKGIQLNPWQSVSLWHACRAAKEQLLTGKGARQHSISILGRGSRLIGGTQTLKVERSEVESLLADGFFPGCQLGSRPARRRQSGFQEIGLPYETDTGITRHIAAFLSDHGEGGPVRPTHMLFNGGVFKAATLRQKLLDVLRGWFADEGTAQPLDANDDLDHAVARGAAYYGWTKRKGGVRIRGGTARSYYVGIETAGLAIPGAPRPLRALCVVPFGMEEGTELDVPSGEVGLVHGESVQFRFFSSATRKQDRVGAVLDSWSEDELTETSPLEAALPADEAIEEAYVPVKFRSHITELGMFELWCVGTRTSSKWKLEFSVREPEEP